MTMQDRALPGGADSSRPIERPIEHHSHALFGSDIVAETLRALDVSYIALNPGASYRGFHDSLVNHLGNENPRMLLCLHEEHAVAIAQGWAKVTGRAMAVAVHSNVGLFHATMAIFNAWCDRMPMVVIGTTGPVDAMHRRPWIDWIHTARDQGAIVRNYVKWDDQPASPFAAREALARAKWISETLPCGPTYVNLDAGMQEAPLREPLPDIQLDRMMPRVEYAPGASLIADLAQRLREAERPVILVGRVSRSETGWAERIALAEATGARVLTDLKIGAGFPTDHPLSLAAPGVFPLPAAQEAIDEADFVLSLDWVVLQGVLPASKRPAAHIAHVSLDHHIHNGWSMDHQALTPVDSFVPADPDVFVRELCRHMGLKPSATYQPVPQPEIDVSDDPASPLSVPDLARQLKHAVGERPMSLLHLPLSWDGAFWPFRHPLDFLGSDGGGGIGGGPGISVGAALALRDTGRLSIAICGDGDFLMGVTALWTAVHYNIPLLVVVANNRSFYNDEVHQERMARMRGRPVENKWIGQRMADPEIDLAALARAQGAAGIGPVTDRSAMDEAFAAAIAVVENGGVAVVDVRVEPGYTPAMAGALTRESAKDGK